MPQEIYKTVLSKLSQATTSAGQTDQYVELDEDFNQSVNALTAEERIALFRILIVILSQNNKLRRDQIVEMLSNSGNGAVDEEQLPSEVRQSLFCSSKNQAKKELFEIKSALKTLEPAPNKKIIIPKNITVGIHAAACQLAVMSGAMRLIPKNVAGGDFGALTGLITALAFATSYTNFNFVDSQLMPAIKKCFSKDFISLAENKAAALSIAAFFTAISASSAFIDASYSLPPINDIYKIMSSSQEDSNVAIAIGKVLFGITFAVFVPLYINNSMILTNKVKTAAANFSWDDLIPNWRNIPINFFRATALALTFSRNAIFFQNAQDNVKGVFFDKDAALDDSARAFVFAAAFAGALGKMSVTAISMDNLAKYLYDNCVYLVGKVNNYFSSTVDSTQNSTSKKDDESSSFYESIKSASEWAAITINAVYNGFLGVPREDAVVPPWIYFVVKASISFGLGAKSKVEKINADKMLQDLLKGDEANLTKAFENSGDAVSKENFIKITNEMINEIKNDNPDVAEKLEAVIDRLKQKFQIRDSEASESDANPDRPSASPSQPSSKANKSTSCNIL